MKKMKRLLTLLLCISMLVIPYPAAAAEASVLTVGTAGGRRGDTVTLDVTLNEVNGIAGGGFNVRYDYHALTLVSAEPGEALKQSILEYCAKHIARYAMPRQLEFRQQLPQTPLGKIDYRALQEEL